MYSDGIMPDIALPLFVLSVKRSSMQLVAVFDECSLPTLPPLLACSVLLLLDQPLLSGGLPSDMSGVFDLKGAIAGAIAGIRDGAAQRHCLPIC